MNRLLVLYRKTNGGQKLLSDADLKEYAGLRKKEYQDSRDKLVLKGCRNVKACKDESGDIIGWTFEKHEIIK